jgi:BMFP domain-containing protein YqiC
MAVQKDRENFQRQMEICERTRIKEAKMVEKIMINEERKNYKIEENQRKYEELMGREKAKEKII